MSERVHEATALTAHGDARGPTARLSYTPPYPQDGDPLNQVLWIAGQLQLTFDVQVQLIETGADKFDVVLREGDSSSMRYYGPFDLAQLRAYLRGLNEGYQYAIRQGG